MKKHFSIGQLLLNIFFIIFCVIIIIPFILVVAVSFSSEMDVLKYGYEFIPRNFTTASYKYIFENPKMILDAYKVTIAFSVIGTFVSVLFTAMAAYPLSQKEFKYRKAISFYFYFTCLFSGGLVPSYLLITKYLRLADNFFVYIIPGCVSAFNVFMVRTFFSDIPHEMVESVLVDGGNDYTIFFKFILPLSKPVIATIALMTFLGKWNDWQTSLLYIDNQKLISLQYLLQRILNNIDILKQNAEKGIDIGVSVKDIPSETVRMAMSIVVAGPALIVFPFFQKYFVKGLTVGSVKG